MTTRTLSPILLFVYNRPTHTEQTLISLQKNHLASDSNLYIYSDGSKNEDDLQVVGEVRQVIRNFQGFQNITIIEREKNWGLADNIVDGVTKLVNEFGKVIVLEDDLVSSPYFLNYMNDALDKYVFDESVMHVSGYMFPITQSPKLAETFFLMGITSCWGWGTWKRAWDYFERDAEKWINIITPEMLQEYNLNGDYDYWSAMSLNYKGVIKTWACFWHASVFYKQGLCLHPKISMIQNIGHDGSGTHCDGDNVFEVELSNKRIKYFEETYFENTIAKDKLKEYYINIKPSIYSRFTSIYYRIYKRVSESFVKIYKY